MLVQSDKLNDFRQLHSAAPRMRVKFRRHAIKESWLNVLPTWADWNSLSATARTNSNWSGLTKVFALLQDNVIQVAAVKDTPTKGKHNCFWPFLSLTTSLRTAIVTIFSLLLNLLAEISFFSPAFCNNYICTIMLLGLNYSHFKDSNSKSLTLFTLAHNPRWWG